MIICLEVENYRSIKDPIELQMTAIKYYKESQDQLIDPKLPGMSGVKILRSAAIYGPNASGKSAIWRALRTMRTMILRSSSLSADDSLPYDPFRLDTKTQDQPTKFSVVFTTRHDTRFEYAFSYTRKRIVAETLCAFPKGMRQVWFSRATDSEGTTINGSRYFRIPSAIKPLVNDNALVLSLIANHRNVPSSDLAIEVVNWFADDLNTYRALDAHEDFPYTGEILHGDSGTDYQRAFINGMMRVADLGVESACVEVRPAPPIPDEIKDIFDAMGIPSMNEYRTVVLEHSGHESAMRVDLNDESDGTRQLFGLSGHIAQALEYGSTLFVDEIDSSLHPIIVREIIESFLNPESNPKNAQLIFTAHNPCLLERGLLRRDQVWFTEKSRNGSTSLYPLSDFRPRTDEAISSGYLVGRYSATPVVPECFGRCRQ
ncbi:AAA family ATPase [Slackia exigua]|uniref:AAA family ATPase n=1 Tax=Slackia exigua TaxID=84109 RepID=UPI003AB975D1